MKPDELLRDVVTDVANIVDPVVKQQASDAVKMLRGALSQEVIADDAPRFLTNTFQDGSVSIEWQFDRRRFAITLERNPADSGWHLVALDRDTPMECDYLPALDLPRALKIVQAAS